MDRKFLFWWRALIAVDAGVILFGLSMVLLPGLILQFFGLVIYSSADSLSAFGDAPARYIVLLHGVLGAVMFGWGIALLFVLLGPFRRHANEGWLTVTVSIAAWFIPDTAFSLWSGFWQNAILNSVFAVAFAVPLLAARRYFPDRRA